MSLIKQIKDTFRVIYLKKNLKDGFIFYQTRDEKDLDAIHRLRHEVYCLEKKFINPCSCKNGKETDSYDKSAIHFVAKDKKTNKIIGTVRLVMREGGKLPMENDFELKENMALNGKEKILEVSRLVVLLAFRKAEAGERFILFGLIKLIFDYCRQHSYMYLAAAIDNHPLKILQRMGFSVQVLGKSKFYMGSESIPILINVNDEFERLKNNKSIIWRFLKR